MYRGALSFLAVALNMGIQIDVGIMMAGKGLLASPTSWMRQPQISA
jgi:hypothetical protein